MKELSELAGATAAPVIRPVRVKHSPQRSAAWRLVPLLLLVGSGTVMWLDFSSEIVGIAALVMMLTMMSMKLPIAVSMIVPGLLGLSIIYDWVVVGALMGEFPYGSVASWSLSVIPMFVLMSMLLWRSGITTKLFYAIRLLLNRVPGSLAVGTNVAGGGLATISGSTIGTTYALAKIGVPEMLRAGYDRRLATSSVLMAGLSGQLIPPSVLLVIYAGVAAVPVGPQLLAGVGPGIVLVACQALALMAIAMAWPQLAGRGAKGAVRPPTASAAEKWRAVVAVWPVPVIVGVVLGGMFTGVLTETEAGAMGAFMALLLTLWARRKEGGALRDIRSALVDTAVTTAAIFFLLMGAEFLSLVLADSGISAGLIDLVAGMELSRVTFLLIVMVAFIILGMFMDTLALIMLTVPILMPLFADLGISPLWFGVFIVLLAELGMITPPVGVLTFVLHSIVQDPRVNLGTKISLKDVFTGVLWLIPVSVVVLLLLIAFPEIALWIPDNM
ncbi:TRAP transporter large permease [Nocardiopsis nanhaiensis]